MSAAASDGQVVYSARELSKHYGPITACDSVDLDIRAGEITAIVGDNGAGKTTLVKMLTGAVVPDAGHLVRAGQPIELTSTMQAHRHGIEVVYQELALAPNLDVASNIFLARERVRRLPFLPGVRILARREMAALAREELKRLDVNIPAVSGVPVGRMSGGQRQSVAIARSVFWASDILFMDEPTAALGVKESQAVLRLIRRVADDGVAVVMVSHAMPHVIELADRVVVMRHGRKVEDAPAVDLTVEQLVKKIVGV
jgi:simple sugar transport system ATP-binding protein